ncbi:hypothetical protein AB0D98_09805 [Streptomyces sp. NPDC047987]|uniref:hypothetical protein n=1 Tax=unclassified Streptomyces TaxID=2593676 RepID=UPI00344107B9
MISNLNQVPDHFIKESRRVHGFERVRLLRENVTPANYPFLDRFSREVIDGHAAPDEWGRGGILVPDLRLSELLEKSASEILTPLAKPENAEWSYVGFDQATDQYDPNGGAPAAIRADLHYSWTPPENVVRISLDAVTLNHAEDIQISIRRWIAFRVSLALGHDLHLQIKPEQIIRSLGGNIDTLSDDALTAISGLAMETATPKIPDSIYGFIGPDDIYEGQGSISF